MKSTAHNFVANARSALADQQLQAALQRAGPGFIDKRSAALAELPEFEALRAAARTIKDETLADLDHYLIAFEREVRASGGRVHWARDASEACRIIADLCKQVDAQHVAKGKSMVGEEIGLNPALENAGLEVIETDLGEYIIQLAHEPPSHIIAPAVHKSREQIAALFRQHHGRYGLKQPLDTIPAIVDEARQVLREQFLNADVGITGANFLIAESGSAIIVTNEGNGDLTATLPRSHIVVAGVEKVVPTLNDANVLLRLLARSATGQPFTAYTSVFTGPRREQDVDGPESFHVVLVDNGRSGMLAGRFRDMLRCIRCGACLNHCPVYQAVGGHAYGWVYPGPMGAVLTPLMPGGGRADDLPNASSLCGRCEQVCPMSIPLPQLLREHRHQQHLQKHDHRRSRWAIAAWAWLACRPALYRRIMGLGTRMLARLGKRHGHLRSVPLAGAWTEHRNLPVPQGATFLEQWRARQRGASRR